MTETKVGEGQLSNQATGSSGFNNAILKSITLGLTGGPVPVPSDAQLKFKLSVRRTCSGGGHDSGTVRLWYNGAKIDSGTTRDAGSRFDAVITPDPDTTDYFLRGGLTLSTTAGSSKLSIDKVVNSTAACPGRSFTSFGTWSLTLP